ncbi:MAG: GntR family transcriptional regulator [Lentisphaerota bacterium]
MQIVKNSGIPKYMQVKNTLIQRIQAGVYRQGDKFLTERELMGELGMSSATISHAMREMANDGFIVRKIGCGTFVTGTSRLQVEGRFSAETTLLINNFSKMNLESHDDINWFIISEIRRGITNTFNGRTKILSEFELLNELESPENKKAILINPTKSEILKLNEKSIDYILINQNKLCGSEYNSVNCEQMHGVYEAMSYMISRLGHRDIAMITRGKEAHKNRYASYRISLDTYDIPFRKELVVKTDDGTENSGYKAMKKLLELDVRPTAVFVDTDIKAIGAIKAIKDLKLRNPEDISIIGFDDIPGIEEQYPLTTVRMPYYEMGETAIKLLYRKISEKKDKIQSATLKTSLIIRKSCAEVSASKK